MLVKKFCFAALCVLLVASTDTQSSSPVQATLLIAAAPPTPANPANLGPAACDTIATSLSGSHLPAAPFDRPVSDSTQFYKPVPDLPQKTETTPSANRVNNDIKGWTNIIVGEQNKIVGGSNVVVGERSKILGDENKLNGSDNMVIGSNNVFKGNENLAKGDDNKALGDANVIKGSGNQVAGTQNLLAGQGNLILGMLNKVRGDSNLLRGQENTLSGNNNQVYGANNDVMGMLNSIYGDVNKVKGDVNDISGDKNAVKGNNNNVNGDYNMITGNGNSIGTRSRRIENSEPKVLIGKSDDSKQACITPPQATYPAPVVYAPQPQPQPTVAPSVTVYTTAPAAETTQPVSAVISVPIVIQSPPPSSAILAPPPLQQSSQTTPIVIVQSQQPSALTSTPQSCAQPPQPIPQPIPSTYQYQSVPAPTYSSVVRESSPPIQYSRYYSEFNRNKEGTHEHSHDARHSSLKEGRSFPAALDKPFDREPKIETIRYNPLGESESTVPISSYRISATKPEADQKKRTEQRQAWQARKIPRFEQRVTAFDPRPTSIRTSQPTRQKLTTSIYDDQSSIIISKPAC